MCGKLNLMILYIQSSFAIDEFSSNLIKLCCHTKPAFRLHHVLHGVIVLDDASNIQEKKVVANLDTMFDIAATFVEGVQHLSSENCQATDWCDNCAPYQGQNKPRVVTC